MSEVKPNLPEPWLRGTLTEMPAVPRAVLHALELAKEDLWKWCFPLTDEQLNQRPEGLASVAFQLRHIARSVDRLLTYAEGATLSEAQLLSLRSEVEAAAKHDEVFAELETELMRSAVRVRKLGHSDLEAPRTVGNKRLPTTLGGLLVHIADHTQRHVGQAIIAAKLLAKR